MQICLFKNKEKPVEYQRWAYMSIDYGFYIYKIDIWESEMYFRTSQGSFLFVDSKATKKVIETKDKTIIKLICYYEIPSLTEVAEQ